VVVADRSDCTNITPSSTRATTPNTPCSANRREYSVWVLPSASTTPDRTNLATPGPTPKIGFWPKRARSPRAMSLRLVEL